MVQRVAAARYPHCTAARAASLAAPPPATSRLPIPATASPANAAPTTPNRQQTHEISLLQCDHRDPASNDHDRPAASALAIAAEPNS